MTHEALVTARAAKAPRPVAPPAKERTAVQATGWAAAVGLSCAGYLGESWEVVVRLDAARVVWATSAGAVFAAS